MIDVIPAVLAILKADSIFMAAIQNRLFHEKSEQPATIQDTFKPDTIVYAISGQHTEGIEGTTYPWIQRVSVDCRGARSSETAAIAGHVYRILENFQGTIGQSLIQGCHPVSDVASSDDTSGIKSRVIDFRITHAPAA